MQQMQAEPNAADLKCTQTPISGTKIIVHFEHVVNGKVVARTSPFTVFDPARVLPPQFVAAWCETLGLDTDDYGLDETMIRPGPRS
jgi:hypothetical protein